MELAAAILLRPRTLAQRASAGAGRAPLTLPIGAIEPWVNVAFHYLNQSTINGVLLYLVLDGFARHA